MEPDIPYKFDLSDANPTTDFGTRHVLSPTCDVVKFNNYWHSPAQASVSFPLHAFTLDYKEEKIIIGFELKNSNNGKAEGDTNYNWCVHEFK